MDSDSSATSNSDDELPSWVAPVLLLLIKDQQQGPCSNNRSRSGQTFVNDLLNCGNPNRIRTVLRMRLDTFLALRDWLVENTALQSSRYVTVEEKLFIFIWIAKSNVSNRDTAEQFDRSGWTISQ
jgi:hypothetical protein